jgi:2-polyprenyl-3-methyl-5-hydroxy-6-metoxy-1,4-benzoquinol methylase
MPLIETNGSDACDVCSGTSFSVLFEATDRFPPHEVSQIARCFGCSVLKTLPTMSEAELSRFYDDNYWGDPPTSDWIKKSQAEKVRFLTRSGLESGSILDVGAGSGYFLRALDHTKWKTFAIETGAVAAKQLAQHLGEENVYEGTICDCELGDEGFDVITFWSALEHMNNPRAALEKAHRIMKQEGRLIIQLPNAASYQLRIFKGDWFALDAPRHRYHFSIPVLERLLRETGFEIDVVTFVSKEHNVHALRQSMKTRFGRSRAGRIEYLLLKPLTRPLDYLVSRGGNGATITLAASKR